MNTRGRKFPAALCCLIAGILSTTQPVLAARSPGPSLDGKALYMATFQGRGPALHLVPEIERNFRLEYFVSAQDMPGILKIYNEIMERLERKDRSFFRRFEQALRSGNHQAIELAMVHAAEMTKEAIYEMPQFAGLETAIEKSRAELARTAATLGPQGPRTLADVDEFLAKIGGPATEVESLTPQNRTPEPGPEYAIYIAAAIAVVIAIPPVVAVALAVAVVVVYAYVTDSDQAAWIGDSLLKEQVIDSLARNLS